MEPNADRSSYLDNHVIVTQKDNSYNITKKSLKNALAREKRAKSTIQSLREKSDVLCDQLLEACKARESMEKALGYLKSIVDTSSAEIAKLQEQINTLVQLTTQQSQELIALSTDAQSVARIMFEGLIAARMQLAHELEHAKSVTICSDGTSIKHQQYETKSTYIQLPTQDGSLSSPSTSATPVYWTFGVQRAPTHVAKQQLDSWIGAIDTCCSLLAHSPLGKGSCMSSKMVAPKLCGMLTDHASDQKRLHGLLVEWKCQCDWEACATLKLAEMSVEEQLNMLTHHLDSSVSGVKDWRSLSPQHQDAVMHDAWFALAAQIGDEEFQKLSPDAQFDVDFLAWAGCCMHKELNVVKGGVANMASAWKELNLVPPLPLPNKYEAEKHQDLSLDNVGQGVIKILDLLGALCHNKDEKKGYHSTVDAFFQNEFGYSKWFPATNHTRFGSYCDAAIEIVLHLETYKKLLKFLSGSRPSQKFMNIEENVFNGLHDIPTLTEIAVLALYAQAVGRPYMHHVRGGTYNALNLGPFHNQVKEYCALKTWERFTSEFNSDGIIAQATPEQRESAWIAPTNDTSEGALGQCRQMLRRAPTMSDEQWNARVMWLRHNTYEWKKQTLTKDDEKFIRQEARMLDSSGVNKKVQAELHNAFQERVEANTIRQAKLHEKQSKQRDKLALVEAIEDATYEQLLSMKVKDLDLQIDKLREEGDQRIRAKSMAPNKQAKVKEILAALKRRRRVNITSDIEEGDKLNTAGIGMDRVPPSEDDGWPEDVDMYFKDEVIF
ncbi:hypothetical protein OPQ81_010610 [Rhizoctonia solani]|nr:hypothetical protein OPQ81_010610 [Rhizoctonia solani]